MCLHLAVHGFWLHPTEQAVSWQDCSSSASTSGTFYTVWRTTSSWTLGLRNKSLSGRHGLWLAVVGTTRIGIRRRTPRLPTPKTQERQVNEPTCKAVVQILTTLNSKFDDMKKCTSNVRKLYSSLIDKVLGMKETVAEFTEENQTLKTRKWWITH